MLSTDGFWFNKHFNNIIDSFRRGTGTRTGADKDREEWNSTSSSSSDLQQCENYLQRKLKQVPYFQTLQLITSLRQRARAQINRGNSSRSRIAALEVKKSPTLDVEKSLGGKDSVVSPQTLCKLMNTPRKNH